MKTKRLLSLLLCTSLLFILLASCASPEEDDIEREPIHGFDVETAFATFSPDTIMISSADISMTWAQFFVFLFRTVMSLEDSFATGATWDTEFIPGRTLADIALERATDEAIFFLALEYGIAQNNISLSQENIDTISSHIDEVAEMYDSVAEFEEALLLNGGFYNREVFEWLIRTEYSISILMETMYGEHGLEFPDAKVQEYADNAGYMMAMHILRMKLEDDGSIDTDFQDEANDESDNASEADESEYAPDETTEQEENPYALLQGLLSELRAYDGSDLTSFFSQLMFEYSEDIGGLMSFPDGYLFVHEDMVDAFSTACAALAIGEISDIVESPFGYHIILRLPIDYDAVPIGLASIGHTTPLRLLAVGEDWHRTTEEWQDSLLVTFSPEYYSIDLEEMFVWHPYSLHP